MKFEVLVTSALGDALVSRAEVPGGWIYTLGREATIGHVYVPNPEASWPSAWIPWTWGKVEVMGHREHFGQYREVDGWIEVIEPAVDLPSEPVSPDDPTRVWEAVSKPEERHRYGKAAIFGLHEMSEEAARVDRVGFRRSTFLAPDGERPVEDIPF